MSAQRGVVVQGDVGSVAVRYVAQRVLVVATAWHALVVPHVLRSIGVQLVSPVSLVSSVSSVSPEVP